MLAEALDCLSTLDFDVKECAQQLGTSPSQLVRLSTLSVLARSRSEFVSPLWLADINTQLGERDLAFEWLERAYESRTQALISLGVSPLYDSLRADHRFQSLLDRIGVASVALQKLGIGDSGLGIRD